MLSSSLLRNTSFRARQATLYRGHGPSSHHEFNPFPFNPNNKLGVGIGMTLAYTTALASPVLVCWFQYWKNGSV